MKRKLRRIKRRICGCCTTWFIIATAVVATYALSNWKHYANEEDRTRQSATIVVEELNELGCPPRRVVTARIYGTTNRRFFEVKPCFWLGITRKESARIWTTLKVGRTYKILQAEIDGFKTIEAVEELD